MNSESLAESLILASSSKYRRMLLERLRVPFDCRAPAIDESVREGESPLELATRLAVEKAAAVCHANPGAIVIGSDQVAVFNGRVIGKPGNFDKALKQLLSFSGQVVEFLTAVSVQRMETGFTRQHVDTTRVGFRNLQRAEIERYLETEKPYDCAGAFKAESLGIVLFEYIRSDDPTALIGLPLIRTAEMLREAGLRLP
jgi:septum formation protein